MKRFIEMSLRDKPFHNARTFDHIYEYVNEGLDQDERDAFYASAKACLFLIKRMEETPKYLSKSANRRIKRVRDEFNKLTVDDRRFLDLHIELVKEMKFGTCDACVDMDYALKQKVASAKKDLSRIRLIDFIRTAIAKNWIGEGHTVEVIKILIEESGVPRDVDAIIREAKS